MMEQFLAAFKQAPAPKRSGDAEERQKKLPWIEKYRPKTIDDVVSQEEVVSVLKKTLHGADFPNLLFYGPPGTGKTSAILAAAKELFGPELYRDRVLELNASDERGIAVIRAKVKTFSELSASGRRPDGRPCPAFKLIVLDEADSMTPAAQAALRRTMERHCRATRFCLICNYVSRLIDPLTSRCAKFRFRPLPRAAAQRRLAAICAAEGAVLDEAALQRVVAVCDGDLRRAVMLAQGLAKVGGGEAAVDELAGVVPEARMRAVWEAVGGGSFERTEEEVAGVLLSGFSAFQCILQLHDMVMADIRIADDKKAAILERIAAADGALIDGADEYLQMMAVCCAILRHLQ